MSSDEVSSPAISEHIIDRILIYNKIHNIEYIANREIIYHESEILPR